MGGLAEAVCRELMAAVSMASNKKESCTRTDGALSAKHPKWIGALQKKARAKAGKGVHGLAADAVFSSLPSRLSLFEPRFGSALPTDG